MKTFNLLLILALTLNSLCACREQDEVLNPSENLPVEVSTFDDDQKDPPKDVPKDRDNWKILPAPLL